MSNNGEVSLVGYELLHIDETVESDSEIKVSSSEYISRERLSSHAPDQPNVKKIK